MPETVYLTPQHTCHLLAILLHKPDKVPLVFGFTRKPTLGSAVIGAVDCAILLGVQHLVPSVCLNACQALSSVVMKPCKAAHPCCLCVLWLDIYRTQ